ncbi:MAG: sigma-54-dependent transcriptional regulator [Acidobacteriota bacterium]
MNGLFPTRNAAAAGLARTLTRLAGTELPVLLEGETGSGKSFVATRLHRRGRPGRPLVVADCGALPEALLAAEMFGHRAGAFTDATRARVGLCERSADGTLVLDRVDTLSPAAQVVLLRTLEERRYVPVGGATARRLRARVVAIADAGLAQRVESGAFRADLYHRLAGFHGVVPPLRDRPEDILPVARTVARRSARRQCRALGLAAEVETLLLAYPWPGNFRELIAVIERACLLATGDEIGVAELQLPSGSWSAMEALAADRGMTIAEVSRRYALQVLAREGGNVTRAAARLGVSRRTLIRWRSEA